MIRKNRKGIRVALLAILVFSACTKPVADPAHTENAAPGTVTIMTFNVENLFDNSKDAGKNDDSYLPLQYKQSDEHKRKCGQIEVPHWRSQCLDWDWSDDVVERKLSVIASAILHVNNGRGPDILALQEVENVAILERLRSGYLGAANYLPAILIEGYDIRGIDVAFLSRLPLASEPTLHPLPPAGIDPRRYDDTRGILEATFRLPDDSLLTGFAVHFPAPFHPTEMREIQYQQLNDLKTSLPADRAAFAAGDFNTTAREDREKRMLQRFVRPLWTVVHDQGCTGCKGTQYYPPDDSWSYLDMILWAPPENRGADATWSIRAGSFTIANKGPGQATPEARPASFELPKGSGVSDHWPLIVTLELN
jgi:endonuclease/exonuclease/phosphatase family metal-dependent hydrolase